jgi:hypothetical protein
LSTVEGCAISGKDASQPMQVQLSTLELAIAASRSRNNLGRAASMAAFTTRI